MDWLYYLLEANLYLLIFYGFYRLFLQHETFYNANRYYLLLSSCFAFMLPILQLGLLKPRPVAEPLALESTLSYAQEAIEVVASAPVEKALSISDYFYLLYLGIALCFVIKLILGISKIIKLWLKAKKLRRGRITLVELNDQAAFSFFNLLFIHPNLATKETVLKHEMVHIRQKHSLDILFFELIHIICWFNPVIYLIKKDIKLLHEYIADELSASTDVQKHEYAMFLIENSFGLIPTALTNQIFNQSILKRRINMLNKKRTAGWARLKLWVAFPLAGGMLCMSTMAFTKDYGYVDLLPEKSTTTLSMFQTPTKLEQTKKQDPEKIENVKKGHSTKVAEKVRVKFPPPIVRKSQGDFYPLFIAESNGKLKSVETRYIIVNGKKVEDLTTFYGVKNAEKIIHLHREAAISKYGVGASVGAVEITGANIKWVSAPEMPPPPTRKIVKFPPPRVVKTRVTGDSIRVIRLKGRTDSVRTVNLKLKPTVRVNKLAPTNLKLDRTAPTTIKMVPLRVKPSLRKIDTLKLTVLKEVAIKTKAPNVQVKREAIRKVNLQLDTSVKNKAKLIEVKIEKNDNNETKYNEIKLLPSTKN